MVSATAKQLAQWAAQLLADKLQLKVADRQHN